MNGQGIHGHYSLASDGSHSTRPWLSPKMILSSRQIPPTMAMRRVPSSSTTPTLSSNSTEFAARYGFRHLLESPLPSPALPSIIPRHGKKPHPQRFRRSLRLLLQVCFWFGTLLAVYWIALALLRAAIPPLANGSMDYKVRKDEALPRDPAVVEIIDSGGRPKWTVSIPPNLAFPLRPSDYANICHQAHQISERLRASNSLSGHHLHAGSYDSYRKDTNFIDIAEAERHNLLPVPKQEELGSKTKAVGELIEKESIDEDMENSRHSDGNVCGRSLTYVLEPADAGLGTTLMGLWMSYGLAQKEGRAFFIDDTNWYLISRAFQFSICAKTYRRAYGKYTTFFKPPPLPSCFPPLASHRVPCPLQARHIVVSAATTLWTFGDAFMKGHLDSNKPDQLRQKPIFSLLRAGHDALFHLSHSDAGYLSARMSELSRQIHSQGGIAVGLHIRHGDRHPWEFQYEKSYIPYSAYVHAAHTMMVSTFASRISQNPTFLAASKLVLASDDPDVFEAPELQTALRAQSHILLASKSTLDAAQGISTSPSSYPNKFVEGNVGWEGGFFSNVFWGLGSTAAKLVAARGGREEREKPGEVSLRLRELVARAYLLDLKVVGSADGVVCGVSSVGCRLLGVMVGWEGVVHGQWRNVDGLFGWQAFA